MVITTYGSVGDDIVQVNMIMLNWLIRTIYICIYI